MTTVSFSISSKKIMLRQGDFLVLPYLSARKPAFDVKQLPANCQKFRIPEKKGAFQVVSIDGAGKHPITVAIARLDKDETPDFRQVRQMISQAFVRSEDTGTKRIVSIIDKTYPRLCQAFCEGALTSGHYFDKYMTQKKPSLPVVLHTGLAPSAIKESRILAECINFARDTLNEPPVSVHPVSLAKTYVETGKKYGLKMTVWDEKRLAREKCGGILAVGGGSANKPRLVMASYSPAKATKHLALVGKGVTFDSGGYSLKPSKSMTEMKFDMGGAAMMFGAICAISALKIPVKVTTFLPLAHNAISQDSYNVSDVVTTRSGQTVEVHNTDAEGRIILSDALTVACEQKPDFLIDSATLTGAAVVALGEDIAAVYGTSKIVVNQMLLAADTAGENMWPMPLHQEYDSQLTSVIADMKNIGGAWGGSITAALFLKRFVKDVTNWMHIDIAGPGCKIDPLEHLGDGAKGFGISSLVQFARTL